MRQESGITGPNAAGKLTAIDSAALNAQTLGICAATALRLTPFTFIHTHKFIESENISGVSSLGAQSKRTIALLQKLQALQMQDEAGVNRLSIVFLDEIFSNTSPREGELGAMTYMQALGNFSRNISISSTHYQQLASLASQYPGTFQNLHVSAEIGAGGTMAMCSSLACQHRMWLLTFSGKRELNRNFWTELRLFHRRSRQKTSDNQDFPTGYQLFR